MQITVYNYEPRTVKLQITVYNYEPRTEKMLMQTSCLVLHRN